MSKRPVMGVVVPAQGKETNAQLRARVAEGSKRLHALQAQIDRLEMARERVITTAMALWHAEHDGPIDDAQSKVCNAARGALSAACAVVAAIEIEAVVGD